jgi:hypothetical protein
MTFPRILTLHLLLAWALAGLAFSCPWCRIENHLHTAVSSAEHIAVVEIFGKGTENHWSAVIRKVLKNDPKKKIAIGDTVEYGEFPRFGRAGEVMLAFGLTRSGEAISNGVLPLDMLPEIQRLLTPGAYPANADEAAEYLTSVSFGLHDAGGTYYKLHTPEVQRALIRRISVLATQAASDSAPYYIKHQLRCGLMALLRIRTAFSDEQMAHEIDDFLQSPEKPPSQEALALSMARLETVFSLLSEQPQDDDRRPLVLELLASAREQQLSRVSQCLIISGLMDPDAILRERPAVRDAPWIKQAVILAAIVRFNAWDRETAATLAQKAKAIPGTIGTSELAELSTALEKQESYLSRLSTQANETPDDAGWYSYSSLFDLASWEKVSTTPPVQDFKTPDKRSEFAMFGAACACLLFLIFGLLRKFRPAQ